MNRKERRARLRLEKSKDLNLNLTGGFGVPEKGSRNATGQNPAVNPFMMPKALGLNVITQNFAPDYYVEWNLTTWRDACDQAMRLGYPIKLSLMYQWVFECSPFVQSLFNKLSATVEKIPIYLTDNRDNKIEEWSKELCEKDWFRKLRLEIIWSKFWGFTGLNIDPINEKIYKYPMQDIDPINRYLRQSTYNLLDGVHFKDNINLLFIQPSTNYESFLGWMQPIARSFIMMNQSKNNWVAAGKRLAFPIMMVGYPESNNTLDEDGNPSNPFKTQAESVVQNADPTNGLVYPYTLDGNGNMVKSISPEFVGGASGKSTHLIYSDFNEQEKNDIREMVFGGTLTSSVGSKGSLALGEIHQKSLEAVYESISDFEISVLNDEFIKKIAKFYKNFPKDCKFSRNKAKQWTLEEIKELSPILQQNGKRLTTEFFEEMGINPEYLEDAPKPEIKQNPLSIDKNKQEKKSLFSLKKKFLM